MASPHKLLDKAFREKAFKAALVRLPVNLLCRWLQITERTWQEWREQGEADPDSIEAQFFVDYDARAVELPVQLLARIAAEKDWRAAAWMLAVWFPDHYSQKTSEASVQVNVHAEIAQARVELQAAVCPAFMDDQDRVLLEAARARARERKERKALAAAAHGKSGPDGEGDPQ